MHFDFSKSLSEVSTSEKLLKWKSHFKLGGTYWLKGEVENRNEVDDVKALFQNSELEEVGKVEASLCKSSKEVDHCLAG